MNLANAHTISNFSHIST